MRYNLTKSLAAAAIAIAGANSAMAVEQGDWIVRVGAAHVNPDASSDPITAIDSAATLDVDSDTQLGITFAYMYTDNIGVGVLAATPFKHDIEGDGSIAALGKVAETKHLPPTLTLQYHFTPKSNIRPFVGAGINYTNFFSEDAAGALAGESVELEDSWGLAAEAGVDIDINDKWFVSGQVWYLDIDTEADISNVANGLDVEIDPWVFMVGIGTTF